MHSYTQFIIPTKVEDESLSLMYIRISKVVSNKYTSKWEPYFTTLENLGKYDIACGDSVMEKENKHLPTVSCKHMHTYFTL